MSPSRTRDPSEKAVHPARPGNSAAVGRGSRRRVVVLSCWLIGSGAVTGCDPVRVLKTSALAGDVRVECAGDAFTRVTREDVLALAKRDATLVVVAERGEEFWITTGRPDGRVEVMSRWFGERGPRDLERVERVQREMLRRLASICGRRDATGFECSTWWGLTPAKKGPTCFLGEEPPAVPVGAAAAGRPCRLAGASRRDLDFPASDAPATVSK